MGLSQDPTKREKQLANLKMFSKEHQPTNGTKPKGTIDLKRRLTEVLLEECPRSKEGRINIDVFIRAEVIRAIGGDKDARAMIWAQFGESYSDGAITLKVVYANNKGTNDTAQAAASEAG